MNRKYLNFLFIVPISAALTACSAEITGDAVGTPTKSAQEKFMDERATIPGPAWTGHWTSKCNKLSDAKFRRWDFNVTEATIVRKETVYKDTACTQISKEDVLSGRYRFIDTFKDGGWNIEYAFDLGSGFTSYPQEKIKIEDNKLYISNYFLADEGMLLINEPLTTESDLPSTPANPPAPSIPAHSPQLGDQANYIGKVWGSMQTESYTNQGYNPDRNEWTIFKDIEGSRIDMGYIYLKEVWSTAQYNEMMSTCVTNGNTLETVTVKAGTFDTCKVTSSTMSKWYGNTPILGLIKIQYLDGSYQGELSSFKLAN